MGTEPVEVKEVEDPGNEASEETAATSEESSESTEESTEAEPDAAENSGEAATEETSEDTENAGDEEETEETPEIKVVLTITLQYFISVCTYVIDVLTDFFYFLFFMFILLTNDLYLLSQLETAPADFRFPTTNQTRHCFTRYVEYHR